MAGDRHQPLGGSQAPVGHSAASASSRTAVNVAHGQHLRVLGSLGSMKRGPKPSGKAMTAAQRQTRYRAAHAEGEPRLRYCRPADRRSMAQRWRDAVGELLDLQDAYRSWSYSLD